MARIDPQAEALVDEYLDCLNSKAVFDAKLKAAKQKLLAYSLESKQKILKSTHASVTVSVRKRTVFPQYNQAGRKELEKLVKDAGYWSEAQSFDVLKLAEAYDANRLPADLKELLAPLAKTDSQVRIFINQNETVKEKQE